MNPFTLDRACAACRNLGFSLEGASVRKCRYCSALDSDETALAHVLRSASQYLEWALGPDNPQGAIVAQALLVAAERVGPRFWIDKPNPDWTREVVREQCEMFKGILDGAPLLSIAYVMQDAGLIYAPDGEDVEIDYRWLQEHLDRQEVEGVLLEAGCERTPEGNWRVKSLK